MSWPRAFVVGAKWFLLVIVALIVLGLVLDLTHPFGISPN